MVYSTIRLQGQGVTHSVARNDSTPATHLPINDEVGIIAYYTEQSMRTPGSHGLDKPEYTHSEVEPFASVGD